MHKAGKLSYQEAERFLRSCLDNLEVLDRLPGALGEWGSCLHADALELYQEIVLEKKEHEDC